MKSSRLKLLVVGLTVSASVVLAGCTSHPKGSTTNKASTSSTSRPVTPRLPSSIPNKPDLRRDVMIEKCAAIHGGWQASGVATNRASTTATYLLTIYFTDSSATVIGYGQTHVKVAPGKSSPWTVSSHFPTSGKVLCVLSGVG